MSVRDSSRIFLGNISGRLSDEAAIRATEVACLSRRSLLKAVAAIGLYNLSLPAIAAACGKTSEGAAVESGKGSLQQRISDAFVYTFPLHDVARTRWVATQSKDQREGALNQLRHRRKLADDQARRVTTPNNDTLYSTAWLELSGGPVELSIPAMGDRYYSLAFLDAFTNNFACLGQRVNGPGPNLYVIAGPAHHASARQSLPAGAILVAAPTNDTWMIGRLLVDGQDDLPRVNALQDRMSLKTSGAAPRGYVTTPDESSPAAYLALVNEALSRNGVPAGEQSMVNAFADIGIKAGELNAWETLPAGVREEWARQLPGLRNALLRQCDGSLIRIGPNGTWRTGLDHIGNFGEDYAYRARVALGGLGALQRTEAIYMSSQSDSSGVEFDGTNSYRLHIPAGVPVDAFWSLSMYEVEKDGRKFFTPNPIHRFSIGDRTRGLARNADGSIDIQMQRRQPDGGTANWLPAPDGRFMLTLRFYRPRAALLARRFEIPDVVRVST
ncbi:DUF1254 domain-containing protein [Cupriavidus metallidurans]|uniref:DUF1254 domain-containing protein n=1 Tax=Cupriavidus metallidurans TaxID=119219 RepID=A0A482J5J4_9BURK|nr:DUF1254 domain-containing protein [Cupriavidus metallidurans]QBP14284.1 DUF1254 domain-containing protein [Cupriavidus metallidurans]